MVTPAAADTNSQIQRILANITAQLSPLAKNPPELGEYCRTHGQHLRTVLKPVGFKYLVLQGSKLSRALAFNQGSIETAEADGNAAQDASFGQAALKAVQEISPLILQANTRPADTNAALVAETAVNRDAMPLFNRTGYQVFFVPVALEKQTFGVVQAWFEPRDNGATSTRQQVLAHFADEMALYFRSRRASDLHRELVRQSTYIQLLESLGGDLDLEAVAWNIVNYAREGVDCERVSIFAVKGFPKHDPDDMSFELLATSGLKQLNARSEQAVLMSELVGELAQTILTAGDTPEGANGTGDEAKSTPPASLLQSSGQPQFRLTFTMRDPDKVATRPEAINDYFDSAPMNWATALPLFDRDNHVCGMLLFEGQRDPDKVRSSFLQMRDLAYSGGHSLGTALTWHNRRTLRWSNALYSWRIRHLRSRGRRNFLRTALPIGAIILALLYPKQMQVSGTATLEPVNLVNVSAEVSGRIEQLQAQLGAEVKKGDLLLALDDHDLQLQFQQADQEYQRYRVQADTALALSEEGQLQIARINAARAGLMRDKLAADLQRTRITAPISGIVIGPQNLSARTGEYIRLGEGLVTLVDPSSWRVRVQLREQDQPLLVAALHEKGSLEAQIKFNAEPTTVYTASLTDEEQVAKGLDFGGGTYGFAAFLPFTPSPQLSQDFRTGFSGRASFTIGRRPLAYVFFRDFIHFLRMRF